MKKTITRILALLMVLSLMLGMPVLAADLSVEASGALDALIMDGVVSIQYAVAEDGAVILSGTSGAYSLVDSTAELTDETLYGTGSVSKMFTTTVVMALVDEGVLSLDTPVVEYLPQFKMADARYTGITVRHLLNHSSGLPGSTWPQGMLWDTAGDGAGTVAHDSFLQVMETQRLKADPGAYSVYCNDGFTLAELVCEAVTGKSFTALIETYISEPLGFENTVTPQSDFDRAELARTYLPTGETPAETINAIGAGGVMSTAHELALFGQIFTEDGGLLSEASREATQVAEYQNGLWPQDVTHNMLAFGLGWDSVSLFPFDRYGITALQKGGDTSLYHATLIVLPEHGLSAAVLTSGGDSVYATMLATRLLLDCLLERGDIEAIAADLPAFAGETTELDIDVSGFSGNYANVFMVQTVDFEEDGTLLVGIPAYGEAGTQRLTYVGDARWQDATGTVLGWFEETNGHTYLVQEQWITAPGIGQTVLTMYAAQKMPEYTPEAETLDAWRARNGLMYLIVSEPYNSMAFMSFPAAMVMVDEQNPGYMGAYKLAGPDFLAAWVQIPVNMGRDWGDMAFYMEDGIEYASHRGYTMMSIAAVPAIWGGSSSICTIQERGYTRWYTIGEDAAGKTMTFECPAEAGLALYDANGIFVDQTAVSGVYELELPEGGFIAFMGRPGDVFHIEMAD